MEFSDEDIKNVLEYVKQGGGLMVAGQAWYHAIKEPYITFHLNR